jgi:hypothetical protein
MINKFLKMFTRLKIIMVLLIINLDLFNSLMIHNSKFNLDWWLNLRNYKVKLGWGLKVKNQMIYL